MLSANCGWKVTGYDREPRLRPPRAKYPITPMSAASIPAAELAAYDAVVYLGGLTGRAACDRNTREQTVSENVDDPLALASRMGPSQLLVFASTSAIAEGSGQRRMREDEAVRTELLDSYSSSMHQREVAMRQLAASKPAGAPQLVGLRFGTVIGVSAGQRVDLSPPAMLRSAYTTGVLKVAHPETARAFLWLEDLCRGVSRTIELRRGGGASVGAPPATAHHSKRSAAAAAAATAPAALPPFAIYHLSSFNSNVGGLAAAIAARTGARIAASNHGDASKDVLGFSLDNSLFVPTTSRSAARSPSPSGVSTAPCRTRSLARARTGRRSTCRSRRTSRRRRRMPRATTARTARTSTSITRSTRSTPTPTARTRRRRPPPTAAAST